MRLDWLDPSDGGSPITEYVVSYADSEDFTNQKQKVVNSSELELSSFNDGEDVYIRVQAKNGKGLSDYSEIIHFEYGQKYSER